MRYPDVNAVVRPTTAPPRFRPILSSWTVSSATTHDQYPMHNHVVFMNVKGEGVTDLAAGHFHRVHGAKIQPDGSDGHEHTLTALSAGAG